MTYLTDEQVKLLLRPIHPRRVLQRDGMSYVEGYDIRAELNRVFGFGRWSEEILSQDVVCETSTKTKAGKDAWYVVYRTRIRLTVCAPDGTIVTRYDGSHVGESTHPVRGEAHGNALTNSETYALRRCAINLGDQFGLSLYNKGSLEAIVRWTLVRPEQGTEAETTDTDDVLQVSAEGEPAAAEEESAADAFENATASAGQASRHGNGQSAADAFENATPAQSRQNGQQRGRTSRPEDVDEDGVVVAEVAHAPRDVSEPEVADEARAAQSGGTPGDDPWYVRPEPSTDEAWLNAALEAAPNHATLDACGISWRKAAEKAREGTITEDEAARLQAVLRVRIEELKVAPAGAGEVVEGEVAGFDADDPWTEKVEDLSDEIAAAGAIAELHQMLNDGTIEDGRCEVIVTLILDKFPGAAGEPVAA